MSKKATYYMHTINERPAVFDGWQIRFASFHGHPNRLCNSLKQIRDEQAQTFRNRAAEGWESNSEYGYFRFTPPDRDQ